MGKIGDIEVSEEAGVRYLHFSSDWIQGAMRIARPWSLELDYTREMMSALLLHPEPAWPRRALLIGLGAASLTKFLHRHRPRCRMTVVEIEPQVVAAARQHFRLPEESTHLNIVIDDGVDYLLRDKRQYDLILVDGFDADARAGMLDSIPFYASCRPRLSGSGLLVVNLLSRRKDFRGSIARLRQAFDDRALAFPSCDSGNAIALAASGDKLRVGIEELRDNAKQLKRETGLDLSPMLARLEKTRLLNRGELKL